MHKLMRPALLAAVLLVIFSFSAHAAGSDSKPANMKWFTQARFGMFVHWNPCTLTGKEMSWSRVGSGLPGYESTPPQVYDNLYKRFNPTEFDARKWVSIAKAAGMKYLVFTTKHHDGFCMFDSKLTDYKITNTPFKRDVVAELSKACHEADIKLGFYYSPPDWHHPDYETRNHGRYIDYLHGQLRELCTNYGKVDIIWFDGLRAAPEKWEAQKLIKMIRKLQPGVVINNRAGLPADYDTPEQVIGSYQDSRPWESCITICNQWAYAPNDPVKPTQQCIRTLINCAGGDGNLLFNVSPNPLGVIEQRQVDPLMDMGKWLAKYGESIYGTRGGPFRPQPWGVTTQKDGRIYLHILDWPGDTIVLPKLPISIAKCWTLTGGNLEVRETEKGTEVSLANVTRDAMDSIVVMQLKNAVPGMRLTMPLGKSVCTEKPVKGSDYYSDLKDWGPQNAVDGNKASRWATNLGIFQAQLDVDLGKDTLLKSVYIDECYDRIQEFELQYKSGDDWKTFATGTTAGRNKIVNFKPTIARQVRLNITKASDGPSIFEFELYDIACGEVVVVRPSREIEEQRETRPTRRQQIDQ